MIDDLLFMSHNTKQLCDQCQVPPVCTAVPLSNNRLLLNDHVIYPNTPCTLRIGATKMYGCVFVSTVVKEKEFKEKRKEPEVRINYFLIMFSLLLKLARRGNEDFLLSHYEMVILNCYLELKILIL